MSQRLHLKKLQQDRLIQRLI